ncbi:MAG: hypothetical protein ABI980_15010 [Nitrospirota bacterium]
MSVVIMDGILSSCYEAVNETTIEIGDHATMRTMAVEHAPEPSQFRVTLFVGPQPVEGRPFTFSCVFNVKKRSWKGGIQVDVVITQSQIDTICTDIDFSRWLDVALIDLADEDRLSHQERAHELFIQAVCWCKLDLALQAGITQENQCLADETWTAEVRDTVIKRTNFITSYIASELDLVPKGATAP